MRSERWKSGTIGLRPYSCYVEERESRQGVSLIFYVDDKKRQQALGFGVRDEEGNLDPRLVQRAKEEARRFCALRLARAEGVVAEPTEPYDPTVREIVEAFERDGLTYLPKRRQRELRSEIELLKRYFRQVRVSVFSRSDWDRLIHDRRTGAVDCHGERIAAKKRRPVSPATSGREARTLRQIMRWGEGQRTPTGEPLVVRDPTRGFPLPKNDNPRRPVADDDLVRRILRAAPEVHPMLEPLVVVAAETGRRLGALVALRWEDWHPDLATHGMLRWRADFDKLGREWLAPVTARVRDTLELLRRRRLQEGEDSVWIFPAPDSSGHVRGDVALGWLQRAERKARGEGDREGAHVKGFGFHALRRAWAMKRKHLSLRDVAHAGGWVTTQTLISVYQQPDLETQEAVVSGGRPLRLVRTGNDS